MGDHPLVARAAAEAARVKRENWEGWSRLNFGWALGYWPKL
jgi:hypothetical protein